MATKVDIPVDPVAPVDPVGPTVDAPVEPEAPVEDATEPVEETPVVPEVETPEEDAAEPVEETPVVPEAPAEPPVDLAAEVITLKAQVTKLQSEIDNAKRDLSPVEEVQASKDPWIDGSTIGLPTSDTFFANLPKNASGQVEYDENGNIVGL